MDTIKSDSFGKKNNKVLVVCLNCKIEYSVAPSLKNRKFCSKNCVDSYKSNGLTANCQSCGKTFAIPPRRKETAKFCGKECQTPKIQKTCQTCGKIYLVRPCHKESKFCNKFCKRHNEETKQLLAELSKGKKANKNQLQALQKGRGWGKGLTKENCPQIAKRAKELSEKNKGMGFPSQFEKYREFMKTPQYSKWLSKRMKKYYAENPHKHINFLLAQKGYETSIEKKMRLALEEKQISFEKQFRIDRFWVDFAIVSHHLAIEVDGAYWHDEVKDGKRDKIINSHGWTVLRFSDKQINKNIDSCLDEIQAAIFQSQQ